MNNANRGTASVCTSIVGELEPALELHPVGAHDAALHDQIVFDAAEVARAAWHRERMAPIATSREIQHSTVHVVAVDVVDRRPDAVLERFVHRVGDSANSIQLFAIDVDVQKPLVGSDVPAGHDVYRVTAMGIPCDVPRPLGLKLVFVGHVVDPPEVDFALVADILADWITSQ